MTKYKMYLILFIVVLTLPSRKADLFQYPNSTHPDHVGKCYVPGSPPKIINVGHTTRDYSGCAELYCNKDYTVYGTGCSTFAGPVHCRRIPGDPSKPYPHCCPELVC